MARRLSVTIRTPFLRTVKGSIATTRKIFRHPVRRKRWPANTPETARRAYTIAEIKRWLRVFLYRFFQLSQFKRSALPNGPKISSGGSLSPRGDWRAPSDASAKVWLDELEAGVPDSE